MTNLRVPDGRRGCDVAGGEDPPTAQLDALPQPEHLDASPQLDVHRPPQPASSEQALRAASTSSRKPSDESPPVSGVASFQRVR